MVRSILLGFLMATVSIAAFAAGEITPLAGEPVNGFPNWEERLLLQWTNRARVAPSVEMTACGANCPDGGCYSAMPPLQFSEPLTRAARFHADNMRLLGFFSHDSMCTLVPNLGAIYPATCDGSASCACAGGVPACTTGCTNFFQRVALFGASASGEIIARAFNPNQAFYAWLHERTTSSACGFTFENGHRFLLLTSSGGVGFGASGGDYVGDFGGATSSYKVPSGAHYPREGSTIELWANWYDSAGPRSANVNVNGVCYPLTLQRGTAANGAYRATVSGLPAGCNRYYFTFVDSTGATIQYPTTGSFGAGPAGSCADWSSSRPGACGGGGTPLAGDMDGDGVLNTADIFYLINRLFAGGPAPIGSGDANGDGQSNVGDVFYLINHMFAGGPAPV